MCEAESVQSFGRYRILGWLGRGGMGSVYLAEQTGPGTFNRKVALKLLRVDENLGEERRLMLIDEAQLTALINHPNIVAVYEAGEHDGKIFIALEWVEGINLATLIKRSPQRLPAAVSAALLAQACDGLHAAHELRHKQRPLNLIHRDVSPSNLMVDLEGRVRVIDFGIARADIRMVTTDPQFIRGNPSYMAPEQLAGQEVDRRADIYTTALVFYEMCTGSHPFTRGPERSAVAPLRVLCPDVGPALGELITASLQLDPHARPAQISLLGRAMWEYARSRGFGLPTDLARYFAEAGTSLIPPEPQRSATDAEFRPIGQPPRGHTVKSPGCDDPPLFLSADTRVRQIAVGGGRALSIYSTHIRSSDRTVQGMALSEIADLLPAPLTVQCLGDALSVQCRLQTPAASRASLYVDAQQPHTRLERLLITGASAGQTFEVGHRKHEVRRLHYTVARPANEGLVAQPGGPASRIVAPVNCSMMVVFTIFNRDMSVCHMECVCIERGSG